MSELGKELLRMKDEIAKAKNELTGTDAAIQIYMNDLKTKFKVKSVKEATKLLSELREEKELVDEKISNLEEKLEDLV